MVYYVLNEPMVPPNTFMHALYKDPHPKIHAKGRVKEEVQTMKRKEGASKIANRWSKEHKMAGDKASRKMIG